MSEKMTIYFWIEGNMHEPPYRYKQIHVYKTMGIHQPEGYYMNARDEDGHWLDMSISEDFAHALKVLNSKKD